MKVKHIWQVKYVYSTCLSLIKQVLGFQNTFWLTGTLYPSSSFVTLPRIWAQVHAFNPKTAGGEQLEPKNWGTGRPWGSDYQWSHMDKFVYTNCQNTSGDCYLGINIWDKSELFNFPETAQQRAKGGVLNYGFCWKSSSLSSEEGILITSWNLRKLSHEFGGILFIFSEHFISMFNVQTNEIFGLNQSLW